MQILFSNTNKQTKQNKTNKTKARNIKSILWSRR